MNIQDIMRGLPFPVQGALMQMFGATANQQPPQQGAGAGRGFVNPPMVNPNAAPPQMPRVQPSRPMQVAKDEAGFEDMITRIMAGGSTDELQNAPAVEASPVQQAMQPDLPAPGAVETAQQAPAASDGEGLLSRFGFSDGNQAMGAIGAALAAAGSQDPAKTALAIQAQRGEEAKLAEARRRGNQPKIEPISGTPFFQITYPDGRMETVNNPALAKFYQEQSASKAANKRSDMELQAELNVKAAEGKAGIKAADEARPQLAQVRETITTMQRALDVTNQQGTWDQVQAAPLISGVAEFFGTPGAAGNKVLQQLKVDDALRNTAQTKGAISNQEMDLFLSPAPSPTADRQTIWKPWIENKISVFKRLEKTLEAEVARAPSAAAAPTAAPAPAAAPATENAAIRTQAAASFGAYEPNKYEYRVGPNGNLQRRLKGQ